MTKRGGGEIPWIEFNPREKNTSKEYQAFRESVSLLQQTVANFHDGLSKVDQFTSVLSSQRRERQGNFLALKSQLQSAQALTSQLQERAHMIAQADHPYLDVKESLWQGRKVHEFFLSSVNPHTTNIGQLTEGTSVIVMHTATGEVDHVMFAPREVRAEQEGMFDFITRHNQDNHLSIGPDGSLEAYVQVVTGRMPLSRSNALTQILDSLDPRSKPEIEQTLQTALRPVVPAQTHSAIIRAFDSMGTLLLENQPEK